MVEINTRNSFKSANFPDHFIRHSNFAGELATIGNDTDRLDATFDVVGGLADDIVSVSLRSANFPNHYLRYQNTRLVLSEYADNDLLRHEASFRSVSGLMWPLQTSFAALDFPGRYLRHRDMHLWVEDVNPHGSDTERSDATFDAVTPFVPTPQPLRLLELVNTSRIFDVVGPRAPMLRLEQRLVSTAQAHSDDLAAHPGLWERLLNNFPGHYGSDGGTFHDRISRAMGSDGNENVYIEWYYGQVPPPDVQRAFDFWKYRSPRHKETMLSSEYRCAGVGIGTGDGVVPAGQTGEGQAATFHHYTMNFHASR